MEVIATPWNESGGVCDCCGRTSRTVWGDLSNSEGALAIYYVSWTKDAPEHLPTVDLIIGSWGEGASPEHRILVSMLYRAGADGGFMVVDADDSRANKPELVGRAMKRAEVVGTPLAKEAFALVEVVWAQDARIGEPK